MTIDLGDTVPLAVYITDDLGIAANATLVVLSVTLPDQTVITPAVTNGAVGTYSASFPTTQAGQHDARWVATGTNACTYSDEFNVLPADLGGIISLADARTALGTVAANTVKDEDLRGYIAAATPIMENIVGSISRTPRVETYDGGSSQICLLWAPLVSVTSIIESYGSNYQRTLTAQDIFAGNGLGAFGYTVDLSSGIVTRRSAGAAVPFATGKRNVQITYLSGRAITGNLLLATRLIIRQLWLVSGQQGFRPGVGGAPDTSGAPIGFAVPNAVLELCAPHARPPGLA